MGLTASRARVWSAPLVALIAASFLWHLGHVFENDLFTHLLLGEHIAAGGHPSGDPTWTFAPTVPDWANAAVVSELLLWTVYQQFSWPGLALLQALATPAFLTVSVIILSWLTPAGRSRIPALVTGAAAALLLPIFTVGLTVRPQTVSYLFAPLLAWALIRIAVYRQWPPFWSTVTLVWAWTLLHGYAILAAPLMAAAALAAITAQAVPARRGKRWAAFTATARKMLTRRALVIPAAALATLATPAGISLYTSAGRIRDAATGLLTEWEPVTHTSAALWLILLTVAVWLAAARQSIRRMTARKHRTPHETAVAIAAEALLIAAIVGALAGTARTAVYAALLITFLAVHRALRAYPTAASLGWNPDRLTGIAARLWENRHRLQSASRTLALTVTGVTLAAVAVTVPWADVDSRRVPVALLDGMTAEATWAERDVRLVADYQISPAAGFWLAQADAGAVAIDGRIDRYGRNQALTYLQLPWLQDSKAFTARFAGYGPVTDVIWVDGSPGVRHLRDAGWVVRDRQEGLTSGDVPVTWVWLSAPDVFTWAADGG